MANFIRPCKSNTVELVNWINLYGVEFMSEVISDMGHPDETIATLVEMLERVQNIIDFYAVPLDRAAIFAHTSELAALQKTMALFVRQQERIDARNKRNSSR